MHSHISAEEAAEALREVREHQARAILDSGLVPLWYFVGLGLLITAFQLTVELGSPVVIAVGSVASALALTALVLMLRRKMPLHVHRSLWDRRSATLFGGWLAGTIGISLAAALAAEVTGMPAPAAAGGAAWTLIAALTGRPMMNGVARRMAAKVTAGP